MQDRIRGRARRPATVAPRTCRRFGARSPATYAGPVAEPDQIATEPGERLPPRFGIAAAVVGWMVGLLCGSVTAGIAAEASGTPLDAFDELPLSWLAFAQTGLWVGLLGAPVVATRLARTDLRRALGLRAEPADLAVGGLAGLVGQFAIMALVYVPLSWVTDITPEEISEPARGFTDRADGALGVVLLVLIVGVGAPIVEEIFWRGLLQRSLVRAAGPAWGVGLTAVAFGAAHFGLLQFPGLAAAGLLFGLLAHRAGRLGPAIACHVVFNLTAVVVLLAGD